MEQPTLFDPYPNTRRQYELFLEANPWVLSRLADMALRLQARGWRRYSIVGLTEALRYEHASINDPSTGWKINNNYRPYMVRDLIAAYPQLAGFFELRKAEADL